MRVAFASVAFLALVAFTACGTNESPLIPPAEEADAGTPDAPVIQTSDVVTNETCGNGFDDDHDGKVDNGCTCSSPWQRCFPFDPARAGVGACKWGRQDCDRGAGELGLWGSCSGAVAPIDEVCGNGVDDDCDGSIDEGCACGGVTSRPCFAGPPASAGVGTCKSGTQTCAPDGTWGACENQTLPHPQDACDGADDDCDGVIDNGCLCAPGATGSCYEGPGGTVGVGICVAGTKTCVTKVTGGSEWGPCTGAVTPASAETCNLQDDNCNGQLDEGCDCQPGATRDCYGGPQGTVGQGACKAGTQTCDGTGHWGACNGDVTPSIETCGNAVDEDCSGAVDNGCECVPGQTTSCYSGPAGTAGVGLCKAGTKTCVAKVTGGSEWGACTGEKLPAPKDACTGKDDDCDGVVDGGCPIAQCTQKYLPSLDTMDCDGDGVVDTSDNCVGVSNANQADTNSNGIGDACETAAANCKAYNDLVAATYGTATAIDFDNKDLRGCTLGVTYTKTSVSFRGANLSCAKMVGAMMASTVDFTDAIAERAKLTGNWAVKTLTATRAQFAHSQLLSNTDIQDADFTDADMRDVRVSMNQPVNAKFVRTNLEGAGLYYNTAQSRGIEMKNVNAKNIELYAQPYGEGDAFVDIQDSDLSGGRLVVIVHASIARTNLKGTTIDGFGVTNHRSTWTDNDFTEACFTPYTNGTGSPNVRNVEVSRSNFTRARFPMPASWTATATVLSGIAFREVTFTDAQCPAAPAFADNASCASTLTGSHPRCPAVDSLSACP